MTTTRTHFTFRVDTWTPDGESLVEHVAGVEDYQIALATFRVACQRWPGFPITFKDHFRHQAEHECDHDAQTPPQITKLCCCFRLQTLKPDKAVFGRCFAFWNTVLSAEAQGTCH
jgi:hypothetical protein